MGRVVPPSPTLSKTDKHILSVLSRIIIENLDGVSDNRNFCDFVLTDAQARELLHLLEELTQSERFLRKLSFVNLIIDTPPQDPSLDLKLVRLTGKRPIGAGIGMTSETMRKWRVRLGVSPAARPADPPPMTFTHFLKMEQTLLNNLHVDPRVAELVLRVAARSEPAMRELIHAINKKVVSEAGFSRVMRLGDLRRNILALLSDAHVRALPKDSVVGLFTIISDGSILFTTRDWGVAGTISTMCGGLAMIGPPQK